MLSLNALVQVEIVVLEEFLISPACDYSNARVYSALVRYSVYKDKISDHMEADVCMS